MEEVTPIATLAKYNANEPVIVTPKSMDSTHGHKAGNNLAGSYSQPLIDH